MDQILDVDLLDFEQGSDAQRAAVIDGVMNSLSTGFVYTSHDISEDLLDTAYGMLAEFFNKPQDVKAQAIAPGSHGATGYTGLLVETAAISDTPDWKEMLNWGIQVPQGHPLRKKYAHRYGEELFPEEAVPGITNVLTEFRDRTLDIQRRFLRVIAVGIGAHEDFFDDMLEHGTTLTRAIRYPPMDQAPSVGPDTQPHVWAAEHGDINLITALPRATTRGLQVKVAPDPDTTDLADFTWVDAAPPEGDFIINTGIMLERLTNGVIPVGVHQVVAEPGQNGERYSVVQFCHPTPWTILSPIASTISAEAPQRFAGIEAGDLLDQVIYDINLVEDAKRI